MCGIAGYLSTLPRRADDLSAMLARLGHRGPDRSAVVASPYAGIGAARLEIVGGDRGAQPLTSESGEVFALNGEIYNWREFSSSREDSDTRAAFDAIRCHGIDACAKFRGGFACAFLDADAGELMLARDQFGQRPLYYHCDRRGFRFASEISALALGDFALERDDVSFAALLRFQFLPPGSTMFKNIRALLPGQVLRVRRIKGEIQLTTTAIPWPEASQATIAESFQQSCARQGAGAVPSALLLSGGLDSSAVAMGLAHGGQGPEKAWVGFYPDGPPAWDERPFARIAAAAAGLELAEFAISAADFAAAMPAVVKRLEEPIAGPGAVAQHLLCREVAKTAKVLFGGQGGDELFGGYERLRIVQDLAADRLRPRDPAYQPLFAKMRQAYSRSGLFAAYEAAVDRSASWWRFGTAQVQQLLGQAAGAAHFVDAALTDPLAAAMAFETKVLLPGLLQVDDRTASSFGMEGRSPFLDQDLWSQCQTWPLAEKSPPEEPRWLFRHELRGFLPGKIAGRRSKLGFPVPLQQWWRGPLREFAGDHLASKSFQDRELIRPQAVATMFADDGSGGRHLYFVIMLELWHQEFLDGQQPEQRPPTSSAVIEIRSS